MARCLNVDPAEFDGGPNLYWYISDALSTVRLVVDGTGSVVASYASDEFGNQTAATGSADLRQHTYTGGLGVRDDGAALGLLYARQRYYDPSVGRCLNADPIGFAGGLNPFVYVNHDPIDRLDPSGLLPEDRPAYTGPVTRETESLWVSSQPSPVETIAGIALVGSMVEFGVVSATAMSTYGACTGLGVAGLEVGETAVATLMAISGAIPSGYGRLTGPARINSRGGFGRGRDFRRGRQQECPGQLRTLQTSGHTIEKSTANALNKHFGVKLSKGEWGGRVKALNETYGLPADFHETKILSNGDVYNRITGQLIGNLGQP